MAKELDRIARCDLLPEIDRARMPLGACEDRALDLGRVPVFKHRQAIVSVFVLLPFRAVGRQRKRRDLFRRHGDRHAKGGIAWRHDAVKKVCRSLVAVVRAERQSSPRTVFIYDPCKDRARLVCCCHFMLLSEVP